MQGELDQTGAALESLRQSFLALLSRGYVLVGQLELAKRGYPFPATQCIRYSINACAPDTVTLQVEAGDASIRPQAVGPGSSKRIVEVAIGHDDGTQGVVGRERLNYSAALLARRRQPRPVPDQSVAGGSASARGGGWCGRAASGGCARKPNERRRAINLRRCDSARLLGPINGRCLLGLRCSSDDSFER